MPLVKKSQKNVINTPVIKNPVILTPSAAITGPVIIFPGINSPVIPGGGMVRPRYRTAAPFH